MNAEATTTTTTAPVAAAPAKKAARKAPAKKANKAPAKPVKAAPARNGELTGLAAAHPEWEGKTANFRRDGALTARQLAVLGVLAKRKTPALASDVAAALKLPEASGKTVNWAIGAVRTETPDPFALLARKLVKHIPVKGGASGEGGGTEHLFEITAPGRKALDRSKN